MKTLFLFTMFLVFSGVSTEIELTDAVDQNKIKVESKFNNLGKDGLSLTITNLSNESLTLSLSPGTIFIPSNEGDQTLINVEEKVFVFAPKQTRTVLSDGYCIQLKHRCPSQSNTFKITKNNNANLASTVSFITKNKVSQGNIQSALWAVTDGEDIGSIERINEADKELRKHIALLTKKKDPWYDKPQITYATPGNQIQRSSTTLEGMLTINATEKMNVMLTVENEANEVKMKINKVLALEKNSENSFNFRVKVSSWEVGKYKVVIRKIGTNEKVTQFDFTV